MRKAGSHLSNRIQEFELWRKDGDFFKDGEYAKRRAKRRTRLSALESDRRVKRWKKLYIPAVIGMMIGAFLTLASTVHGLGKDTLFWSEQEAFHIIGPVFLTIGLLLLVVAAACSHHEEEKLRIKLGLPSMFPQSIKTLPSSELTSITLVSDLDSSNSLSEKLNLKSKDNTLLSNNSGNTDSSETTSFVSPLGKSPDRNKDIRVPNGGPKSNTHSLKLNKRNISFQSGYCFASEQVFERENEMAREDEVLSVKETDIDAYCAMIDMQNSVDIKSASCVNSELMLPDIDKSNHIITNIQYNINSDHPLLEQNTQDTLLNKSKESESIIDDCEQNIPCSKKEKSRMLCFHRLLKAKDRFLSSASETSSGYSSGPNVVDAENFESFDSETDMDATDVSY